MNDFQRQFWSIIRSFAIRYNEYNRQKGASSSQLQDYELIFSKILSQRQLKEAVITKITGVQLKSDYHNLLILTVMQELVKWSIDYHQQLKDYSGLSLCIISQSINLLNNQKQYHTIIPKQNELISILLTHHNTLEDVQRFRILYVKLKDIKDFYSKSIQEHQKQSFLKSIQQSIQKSSRTKNIRIVQFIFDDIFNQLLGLEETHQCVSQRLKILRKTLKNLWVYHQNILYKMAYLLMKYSYKITVNRQLFIYTIPIYQILLENLIKRSSMVPLITYKHFVYNNIDKILKNGGNYIQLQILLNQLSTIFKKDYLQYFMKNYDWNFMEQSVCQQSLSLLYQYTENRTHQKKYEFELTKIYIYRVQSQIKNYLQEIKGIDKDKQIWKIYEAKKKQYQSLIVDLNGKPKHIFKRIQALQNPVEREQIIQRYVKLIKKSCHIQNRSMINIFSTDNSTSAKLFSSYVQIVLKQCKQYNLEQFMRLFTSNFFLTGESQQIARVMDTITQLYYRHQESQKIILKSSNATYTFANAILILNTDLHNPKNQQKMSEQNFLKMCKKINEDEDLPQQVIKKTYGNIKMNKINTFRDRSNMLGISLSNWLIFCSDYESLPLSYYDNQLQDLDDKCLKFFIMDVLTFIIDQKQTAKLQLLVQTFIFDEKMPQCQIIQIIRRVVDKKSHIPLYIIQKIQQIANFKSSKANIIRTLSFYWLGANIILNFSHLIPTNLICEFLVNTWSIRIELQDNMYRKQSSQIQRIKDCIKQISKRQAKKSIMNMFSSFLSFTQFDEDIQVLQNDINRRTNFKPLSNNIFEIVKNSESHRILSIQFLIDYIHNQQSKLYEQFVSCMYLIFNLLYETQGCERIAEDLFQQLLGIKQSSLTKRLDNLGKKQSKLYNNIINYCRYWILKLLLKEYQPSKLISKINNNYQILLSKSLEYLQKINKDIFEDLLDQILVKNQISVKTYQIFQKTIQKIYPSDNINQVQRFFDKFYKKQKIQDTKTKSLQDLENNIQLNLQNIKQRPSNKRIDSLRSSQQFINPDAMMQQIQHQIQQHLKVNDKTQTIKSFEKNSDRQNQSSNIEKTYIQQIQKQQALSKNQSPSLSKLTFLQSKEIPN